MASVTLVVTEVELNWFWCQHVEMLMKYLELKLWFGISRDNISEYIALDIIGIHRVVEILCVYFCLWRIYRVRETKTKKLIM